MKITDGQLKMKYENSITAKFFSHNLQVKSQFNFLSKKIELLDFNEVAKLSKIEDIYSQKEYLTEKQINVLHGIVKKYY